MNNFKPTLKDILLKDAVTAKSPGTGIAATLTPGTYIAKIINFEEKESYQYVTVEINKKRYNFFYNYYIYQTTDLNLEVINWIKALATIPVDENTSLLQIANSSYGSSYKIEVYNYISKTGKNAGKTQHAISFKDLPIVETVVIETEEIDALPF